MDPEARILATVDEIPRGEIRSYGEVAEEAGLPRRARLVGKVLSRLRPDSQIPWHRVVLSSRHVAEGPQQERQLRLLAEEGIVPRSQGRRGPLIRQPISD